MDNNLVGQTIQGRYYVVKQLGRGGVGVTFLAQDRQCFDDRCVVKQLKPKTANPKTLATARRLFNREAEIMNRLGHCDRIPRLLAYFEQDREFFLVQELIEGHDLSQEIIEGQPWSEAKTIILVRDILEVLLSVQQHSVIHRDLKPSNLMRRRQDQKIILIDFGSVKQVSTQIIDAAGVKQTVAVGTKSYMPMEQMMGRPGFYSDIYALGVIAIQALTGINPLKFETDNNGEIIWRNLLQKEVNYQPRLLEILDKMVRYRFQERYTSAGVALAEIKQLNATHNRVVPGAVPRNNEETIIVKRSSQAAREMQPTRNIEPNTERETSIINQRGTVSMPAVIPATPIANSFQANKTQHQQNLNKSGQKFNSKLLLILGTLALLTTAWGGWTIFNQKATEPNIKLSLYENAREGFKVDYPEQWSKQNRDDFFATGVVFVSPLENNADRFRERVSVLVEKLPSELSLAEYTKESLLEIKKLSDPKVGEAEVASLGENEGRRVIYDGEENGSPVHRMQTWSVKGNQAYIITYTAQPESFDRYLPIVEKMIQSFEII